MFFKFCPLAASSSGLALWELTWEVIRQGNQKANVAFSLSLDVWIKIPLIAIPKPLTLVKKDA